MTSTIKERYLAYWADNKTPVLEFTCPYRACATTLKVAKPPRGDTWDSMATCPHCERDFYYIATNRKVKTKKLTAEPQPHKPVDLEQYRKELIHGVFYMVYGSEDGEGQSWRAAWWDREEDVFFDNNGEELVNEGLLIVPGDLPDVP